MPGGSPSTPSQGAPPRRANGGASGTAYKAAAKLWKEIGKPPENILQASEWAFKAVMRIAWMAMNDPGDPAERRRRREVLECIDRAPRVVPYAEIAKATGSVHQADKKLKKPPGPDPQLEDASHLKSRGGPPQARRGRPPRRAPR